MLAASPSQQEVHMTRLGFVILYTRDVARKMAFYERAFGMEKKHLADKEVYGEMHGEVPLQFVQEDFVRTQVKDFVASRADRPPAAIEIGFLFDDVPAAYQRAIEAGCTPVGAPEKKPWGPVIGFVRDDEGVLIELCSTRA
jgi:lactoylglutathione lyase